MPTTTQSKNSHIKSLEKAVIKAEKGEHLRKILTKFCKKNNLPYPQTVLPKRNGASITIGNQTYNVCNELVLSWNGQEMASLKEKHDTGSYLEARPKSKNVYVPPKQKSFGGYMVHNNLYTLEGTVNGEEISLKAKTSEGSNIKMYVDERPLESTKRPKTTTRIDNNKKYWFLVNTK